MADEEKEKAEKLAAAKKRVGRPIHRVWGAHKLTQAQFEKLKKDQQKKAKTTGTKKKDEPPAASASQLDETVGEPVAGEENIETVGTTPHVGEGSAVVDDGNNALPAQQPSLSLQSKQRSESFRAGSTGPLASPHIETKDPGPAHVSIGDVGSADAEQDFNEVDTLRTKAAESDRLSAELASVQRQLQQAQQSAKGNIRRASTASPDLSEQLESKTKTVELLELELSNLRNQLTGIQTSLTEREASAKELEDRAGAAETKAKAYEQELNQLKVSMAFPSDETKAANEDPEALTKRISVLESDLRTATTNAESASQRAKNLEQKIEAFTKLHRDASTAGSARERELTDMRSQLQKRDRPSHVRDASDFELGEEETETGSLQAKIRSLEAENFELRRGVWRDRRASMQPGIDDSNGQEYEDVDLNAPYTPQSRAGRGSIPRQGSTFQDVITSGISAFTGRPREPPSTKAAVPAHARKESLGLLDDDDDGFDEEAFAQAQEEEAKRRLERVKEVKRGLEKWKGWRVDLMEARQAGIGGGRDCGPVFEV